MCGTPLSNKVENEYSPRMGVQGQPELPAWLETLKAGERTIPPAKKPANFSAADLVEEGTLPGWMRSERIGTGDSVAGGPQSAMRSSSLPGQNTDEGAFPAKGFAAQSLIDEQSLPSWMQEGGKASTMGPVTGGGLAGSNLVQSEAAPDWLKQMPQATNPRASWTPQPPAPPVRPMQSTPVPPPPPVAPTVPPVQGFSAHDLIDPQSLPNWMAGQDNQNQASAVRPPTNPMQSEGANLSASSLLETDSLPQWLREAGQSSQKTGQGRALPPTQASPSQANATWQADPNVGPNRYIPQPTNGMGEPPRTSGALSAASFIDENSLPNWLRTEQSSQGPASTGRSGTLHAAPRPDNVRVPSRPRSEINTSEGSEVAANVFTSMLGPAPASPNFSGPAPTNQPNAGFSSPSAMPQGMAPSPQYPPMMGEAMPGDPFNQAPNRAPSGMLGVSGSAPLPPQGTLGVAGPPPMRGNQGGYDPGYPAGGYPPTQMGPGQQRQMNQPRYMTGNTGGQKAAAKPAKRGGLFSAIQKLFFRS